MNRPNYGLQYVKHEFARLIDQEQAREIDALASYCLYFIRTCDMPAGQWHLVTVFDRLQLTDSRDVVQLAKGKPCAY